MGVYFFYGDEDYLIDKELEKFRQKLDKNFSEMNYAVYDKLEFGDLITVLKTQPMMFGKMMIVINTHSLCGTSVKSESLLSVSLDDKQIAEIESALDGNMENNADTVDIFFVEKYAKDDKKKSPDSRRKIFKVLSKYVSQQFTSIPAFKRAELGNIISSMAKSKKLKITQDGIEALIDSKGNNLRAYDVELDKLGVYAHPETTITKSMVEEICSATEDLFNLTNYLMTGKKGEALLELRRLLITKYPLEIIVPLQTMLKQWIFMKLNAGKMSNKEIGERLGRVHEYRVKLALDAMRNIKVKSLIELRENITDAEYRIKTGKTFSPEEELENAVIR